MITAAKIKQDLQRDSNYFTLGDEPPSLNCDLGELNSTEFEQLLLQSLSDTTLLEPHHMQLGLPSGEIMQPGASCDLASLILEDVPRPRDIHLSFPGDCQGSGGSDGPLQHMFTDASFGGSMPDASCSRDHQTQELPSFLYQPVPSVSGQLLAQQLAPASSSVCGRVTPPHSGGVTPQGGSRAASPAWSESSGNLSCSSLSSTQAVVGRQRCRHHSRSSVGSSASTSGSTETFVPAGAIPRHKRPSHKRAEIKRRDKIKNCLEDMKDAVPSLREKGKLSESAILLKAAEYIHHLKDGQTDRGNRSDELRQEIECLSKEIHSLQENLPAAGLKEESASSESMDDLHQKWLVEKSQNSTKFCIFNAITSKMWHSFKDIVGPAGTVSSLAEKVQEWQTNSLALPVLRKQILDGLLNLSRQDNSLLDSDSLKGLTSSPVDPLTCKANS